MQSHVGQQLAAPGRGKCVFAGIELLIEQQVFHHREALNGDAGLADHLRRNRFIASDQVCCFPGDQVLWIRPELELPGEIVVFDRAEIDKTHSLPGQKSFEPGRFQAVPAIRCGGVAVFPGRPRQLGGLR